MLSKRPHRSTELRNASRAALRSGSGAVVRLAKSIKAGWASGEPRFPSTTVAFAANSGTSNADSTESLHAAQIVPTRAAAAAQLGEPIEGHRRMTQPLGGGKRRAGGPGQKLLDLKTRRLVVVRAGKGFRQADRRAPCAGPAPDRPTAPAPPPAPTPSVRRAAATGGEIDRRVADDGFDQDHLVVGRAERFAEKVPARGCRLGLETEFAK